jgi:hypothetical protein
MGVYRKLKEKDYSDDRKRALKEIQALRKDSLGGLSASISMRGTTKTQAHPPHNQTTLEGY